MTDAFKSMLSKLGKIATPARERTLFGLGGRGYYENPTSDLLAFFLRPTEEHGLSSMFLDAFLECLGEDPKQFAMQGVTVSREVEVSVGGRIDLLVRGLGWVLIIENKVYHVQANPFVAYASYGKSLLPVGEPLLSVLSPDGETDQKDWKGVSYHRYCEALRRRLTGKLFNQNYSKWLLFAREFILHIENELYSPTMTPEQITFADQHTKEVEQAKKLFEDYRRFLLDYLPTELGRAVPGVQFSASDHGWAIRCRGDTWGKSDIAYWYVDTPEGYRPKLSVYLMDSSESQHATAQRELRDKAAMQYSEGRNYGMWSTTAGFATREAAVMEMGRLARVVSSLLPPVTSSPNEAPLEATRQQ